MPTNHPAEHVCGNPLRVGLPAQDGYTAPTCGAGIWTETASLPLGPLHVTRVRCAAFGSRGNLLWTDRSELPVDELSLTVSDHSGPGAYRRDTTHRDADLVLHDTFPLVQRSGAAQPAPGCGSAGSIVRIPREVLPLNSGQVHRLLSVRMSGQEGIGAVLAGALHRLVNGRQPRTGPGTAYLSTAILDLIVGLLVEHLDGDRTTQLAAPDALLLRIQAFIEQRLADPVLTPAEIAAAHHVSSSYVQKVFQRCGLTLTGWIRERRLERCRRDLVDPVNVDRSVQAIAARWGFTAEAHFSRAFRAAYGLPPATWRRRALTGRTRGTLGDEAI